MKLGGTVGNFTPTVGTGNWWLESASTSQIIRIQDITCGGLLTSSTAMQTRIARDTNIGTTRTVGNVQRFDLTTTTPGNAAYFCTTYSSVPTISAGSLVMFGWNANGGFCRWLAAPDEEIFISIAASVECRPDVGAGLSNYGVVWEER